MIKLEKPEYDQKEVIKDCISNMREGSVRSRIASSMGEIEQASDEYDRNAIKSELYELQEHERLTSGAMKGDMVKLYDEKFARSGQGGRKYYDKIILSSPNKRCPYCGQREVSTLDHYLAKTKFPVFAVTPYNLVPSCSECNKKKTSRVAKQKEKQAIHPYYDDFTQEAWISAKMIEQDPIAFEFFVECPEDWDIVKKQRAQNHFEEFELNDLYKPYAAEEYIACLNRIKFLFKLGGKKLVVESLRDDIRGREQIRLNSWQAAMYQAIIDSDWFWEIYLPEEVM